MSVIAGSVPLGLGRRTSLEQALAARRDLQEQWRRFQRHAPQQLSARDQEAIRQAVADLPRLWEAPGVTHADRKEVVRAVLDEITVSICGVSELVDLTLHWAGGRTTTGLVRRPIQYFEHLSYYPRLQQRVLELAEAGWHPEKIADQLNRDGYQSAHADGPIRYRVVAQILRRNGRPLAHRRGPLPIGPAEAPRDNEWVLPQLAAHLGCTTGTLHGWLRAGHLTGRQETRAPHRWILLAPPKKVDELVRPMQATVETGRDLRLVGLRSAVPESDLGAHHAALWWQEGLVPHSDGPVSA